jgi:inositol-pentakisphosphate 2-kinase
MFLKEEVLVREFTTEYQTCSLPELRQRFALSVAGLLLTTPVLQILSKLQRTLDSLDIEGLSKLWRLSHGDSIPIGSNVPEPTLNDWTNLLDTYFVKSRSSSDSITTELPDASHLLYHLHAYLLSATFKDCSIILKLPNLYQSMDASSGSITVIDLDQKPVKSFAKWQQLDKEIVEHYSSVPHECRHRCIDSAYMDVMK